MVSHATTVSSTGAAVSLQGGTNGMNRMNGGKSNHQNHSPRAERHPGQVVVMEGFDPLSSPRRADATSSSQANRVHNDMHNSSSSNMNHNNNNTNSNNNNSDRDVQDYGYGDDKDQDSDFRSDNGLSRSSSSGARSGNNDSSSASFSVAGETRRRRSVHPALGRKETRQIKWVRIIVFSALFLATGTISIIIYVTGRSSEQEDFEDEMVNQGATVLDSVTLHFHSALRAMDHFAVSVVAEQKRIDPTAWPNVTVADFAQRAGSLMDWAQLSGLVFIPKVTADNREGYEAYVQDNVQTWLPPSMAYYNRSDPITKQPVTPDSFVATLPRIHRVQNSTPGTPEEDANAPFFPAWQHAPPIPGVVNLNFAGFDEARSRDGRKPRSTSTVHSVDTTQTAKLTPLLDAASLDKSTNGQITNAAVLRSSLLFPVVHAKQTVAILWGTVNWDVFLQPTNLSPDAAGMQIVLTNPCGNGYGGVGVPIYATGEVETSYTFFINDDLRVEYEGIGDRHDSDFNNLKSELDLSSTASAVARGNGGSAAVLNPDGLETEHELRLYSGIKFNETFCPFNIRVYPTRSIQQDFLTANPLVYTALVIVVFIITSLVFLGYDVLVEQRQRKVLKTATKSHQIVSSLFPQNVRDRLFHEGDEDARSRKNNNGDDNAGGNEEGAGVSLGPFVSQKTKLKGFLSKEQQTSSSKQPRANAGGDNRSVASMPAIVVKSKPIADLFPHTTVLFADIAGFTAWSSSREPSQVFTLLETLYGSFDGLAERRRVFKVETIGDCYVAVTGLPDPQADHAVIMVKFAGDILVRMTSVTNQLELELGPDTSDLGLRIGMHSGPVTAGVLRGQKSRFQLFGDTVNTASRMESNGKPNRIQCSQSTADLLVEAGKRNWIQPRQDEIHAKGKGIVQTFWVHPKGVGMPQQSGMSSVVTGSTGTDASSYRYAGEISSHASSDDDDDDNISTGNRMKSPFPGAMPKATLGRMTSAGNYSGGRNSMSDMGAHQMLSPNMKRLIDWNVDLLSRTLRNIVAKRLSLRQSKAQVLLGKVNPVTLANTAISLANKNSQPKDFDGIPHSILTDGVRHPRDMYVESIHLPQFDRASIQIVHPDDIVLKRNVQDQLRDYITKIACSYHDNPFHNFDHASHVTLSANKILSRIVAADDIDMTEQDGENDRLYQMRTANGKKKTNKMRVAAKLHDYTYGITSDPLTHFACVFSAMIHDVDHPGVPNGQLIHERDTMAALYNNKSIAEQNSVDLAWGLLMDPGYGALRKCLFADHEDDQKRFQQLLVNSVMATDIFDPELNEMRNRRWVKAFASSNSTVASSASSVSMPASDESDLRATIVIEHIIQAADVSHTMQHWHVYQKWNRRLFEEMYSAFQSGRVKQDPSKGWYKGELWFYDNYIIPLAKKLSECGVFGVSSDEFLNYAMSNRAEWELKGEEIVAEMVETFA